MSSQLHSQKVFNSLFTNAAHPVGWVAKRIKIGRFVLEDVHVLSREGSHDLNDTLRMANDKSRRVRGAQSRYSDPLPSSAPPRIISIESEVHTRIRCMKRELGEVLRGEEGGDLLRGERLEAELPALALLVGRIRHVARSRVVALGVVA